MLTLPVGVWGLQSSSCASKFSFLGLRACADSVPAYGDGKCGDRALSLNIAEGDPLAGCARSVASKPLHTFC